DVGGRPPVEPAGHRYHTLQYVDLYALGLVGEKVRRTPLSTSARISSSGRRYVLSRSALETTPISRPMSSTTGNRLTSSLSISRAAAAIAVPVSATIAGEVIS